MRPCPAGAAAPAQGLVQTIDGLLEDVTAAPLAALRQRRPRAHCITNAVAQAFTANVLLAAGAIPSNTKVDTSKVTSPSAKLVLGWLGAGPAIVAHNSLPSGVEEEWHRQSQLLLTGETIEYAARFGLAFAATAVTAAGIASLARVPAAKPQAASSASSP